MSKWMWRLFAACDPSRLIVAELMAFKSNKEEDQKTAKAICNRCPGRRGCLDYTLSQSVAAQMGVPMAGAMTIEERLQEKRRRAKVAANS